MMSGNYGGFGNGMASGIGGFLGGLFGDSSAPYEAASDQYKQYLGRGIGAQNPFYNAGAGAIPQYQQWLQSMQNPSAFINSLMGQYQQSPWAKYQQNAANREAVNLGSASGLTGSTPLQLQAQQNAANISSQDMQNWLGNVLGINNQYGAGQGNLIGVGQGAANQMGGMYNNFGQLLGESAYGQQAGKNQDLANLIGGGVDILGALFGL